MPALHLQSYPAYVNQATAIKPASQCAYVAILRRVDGYEFNTHHDSAEELRVFLKDATAADVLYLGEILSYIQAN